MSGPKDDPARVRAPTAAGTFYPADPAACRTEAEAFIEPWFDRRLASAKRSHQRGETKQIDGAIDAGGRKRWMGGVVPHAGWICSGAIAGRTIGTIAASRRIEPPLLSGLPHRPDVATAAGPTNATAIADASRQTQPDVVIVLGAVHTPLPIHFAALDDYERWAVPNGSLSGASLVLAELRAKLLAARGRGGDARSSSSLSAGELFATDDRFHRREHAVEVELPLIAAAWPDAAIVPVEVPTIALAEEIGRQIARHVEAMKLDAVILASSDLTHYGPAYRFAPAGVGLNGLKWAKQNDRRLLDRIEKFDPGEIVPEVQSNFNACGGGAIAAMLSACHELGANVACVLHHANSYETLAVIDPQPPDNAVGYASVVVG
ncbi:hypothetical protein BH09PLA1_BH09PLA1_14400 [soil metagenome]